MKYPSTRQVYRGGHPQLCRPRSGVIVLRHLLFGLLFGRSPGDRPEWHRVPFRIILFRVYLLPSAWLPRIYIHADLR